MIDWSCLYNLLCFRGKSFWSR